MISLWDMGLGSMSPHPPRHVSCFPGLGCRCAGRIGHQAPAPGWGTPQLDRHTLTSSRRRFATPIVFGLSALIAACGGDGVVLPNESRPAKIEIVTGDGQQAPAGATLSQPIVVKVKDALDRPVEGQAVAFTIDAGGGQVTPASVETGADGESAATWTLGSAAGQQRVQARVTGTDLLIKFTASAQSGAGSLLELVSGDHQTAAVGSALGDSLVVRVTDALGNPVAGVEVSWSTTGGGTISPANVISGTDGTAAAERVLGSASGQQGAQAAANGIAPVAFTHTAEPANPTSLVMVSGNQQVGGVGAPLPDSLVVRLVDNNGNGVGGKAITWVVGNGGGSPSPSTSTTNPNGLAGTQWTLGPNAGSNLINAVFSGVPSVPFTAQAEAGAPTKLTFTQPPVTTSAGSPITPAVRVAIQDGGGNTVTSATGQVTVAIGANPGAGTLSGTATANAVNGVATFANLSIDKTGNGYTLVATASGLNGATSPAFDILTGSANRLVFLTGPTNRVVGEKFSPGIQVQVQDAGGNPVISAAGLITLTSSTTGTLSGTATATPVLGTATFSNLAINKAGAGYTLTALSSGITSVTSADFDVAQASTTVAIVSKSPSGASVTGQSVTFNYDVNVAAPGASAITGTVTVTDGVQSCTGGINAGSGLGNCAIAFASAGARSVTATYSGDANLQASPASAGVAHTVNKANTTLNVLNNDAPDPSVVGQTVTVNWTLAASGNGAGTPSGSVNVTATGSTGCSAAATFGAGSCQLVFTAPGNVTIQATYAGDENFNGSNDTEGHNVQAGNTAPTAAADPYNMNEDGTLAPAAAAGVLINDDDPDNDPLTAVLDDAPSHDASFTFNGDGSFSYTPEADFNGEDSFTYHANDGALNSNIVTVTITVAAVNDAPSFTSGGNVSSGLLDGAFSQPWATGASPGPADESGQTLSYTVGMTPVDSLLFSVQPSIAPDGTLTFTPLGLFTGDAQVTVHVQDTGGTANGGVDTSGDQTFTISIN